MFPPFLSAFSPLERVAMVIINLITKSKKGWVYDEKGTSINL